MTSRMDISYITSCHITSSQLSCEICKKDSFKRKCDLTRHINNTHGNLTTCLLCDKKLKSGRRRDVRIRHLVSGCPIFKKSFEHEPSLSQLAKKHADEFFDIMKSPNYKLQGYPENIDVTGNNTQS